VTPRPHSDIPIDSCAVRLSRSVHRFRSTFDPHPALHAHQAPSANHEKKFGFAALGSNDVPRSILEGILQICDGFTILRRHAGSVRRRGFYVNIVRSQENLRYLFVLLWLALRQPKPK
jgi:hypothetical protein